jgi:hypothetical protein
VLSDSQMFALVSTALIKKPLYWSGVVFDMS